MSYEDWFREDRLPHIFCAGCGNGTIINCTLAAIDSMGWKKEETVFVSGIGCSSRAPGYILADSLHTTHGRALAFATGVKMANPDLNVVVFTGDGDLAAIGGNHFIHACRRNIDMLYIVMDNRVYGMTKGQPSPTTEADWDSDIAPGGLGLRPFNPIALALAAGANFVARGFAGRGEELANLIVEGIRWPGFAFIEVLSPCMAFRSEAFGWKANVHPTPLSIVDDRAAAQAATLADDGYSLGLLFKDHRPSLPRQTAPLASLAQVEAQFQVCG